jgi:hypothetical protein
MPQQDQITYRGENATKFSPEDIESSVSYTTGENAYRGKKPTGDADVSSKESKEAGGDSSQEEKKTTTATVRVAGSGPSEGQKQGKTITAILRPKQKAEQDTKKDPASSVAEK